MPLFRALLLPALALLVVAALLVAVAARPDGDSGPATAPATVEPAEDRVTPKARSDASVCDGSVGRPDPRDPKSFPAEYTKRIQALGISVVATSDVSDQALAEARETIEKMFASNDLATILAERGAYVVVADEDQGVLDLPEFKCMRGTSGDDFYDHVCGVADRADYPVVTVNELDLLGSRRGPCSGLNILYHELGHLVQGWAVAPADYFDIRQSFQAALSAGKYKGQYAARNANEYFAEATQAYFFYAEPRGGRDRRWLKSYDPDLYELLVRIYGEQ